MFPDNTSCQYWLHDCLPNLVVQWLQCLQSFLKPPIAICCTPAEYVVASSGQLIQVNTKMMANVCSIVGIPAINSSSGLCRDLASEEGRFTDDTRGTCTGTFVVSARMGICMMPRPPFLRGVLIHAKWVSSVSQDAAMSWQLSCSNCYALSLKAMISVGHTNVKSCTKEACDSQSCRFASSWILICTM